MEFRKQLKSNSSRHRVKAASDFSSELFNSTSNAPEDELSNSFEKNFLSHFPSVQLRSCEILKAIDAGNENVNKVV
jgi:hypothetical protein